MESAKDYSVFKETGSNLSRNESLLGVGHSTGSEMIPAKTAHVLMSTQVCRSKPDHILHSDCCKAIELCILFAVSTLSGSMQVFSAISGVWP